MAHLPRGPGRPVGILRASSHGFYIRNNRPTLVVLTEEEYARLAGAAPGEQRKSPYKSVWEFLLHEPSAQTRTKEQIDAYLREERASWGDR